MFSCEICEFLKKYIIFHKTPLVAASGPTNTCALVAFFYLRLLTQDKLFVRKVYVMETLTKKKKKKKLTERFFRNLE